MKYLFIGGPLDGQRIDVHDTDSRFYYQHVKPSPVEVGFPPKNMSPIGPHEIETDAYRKDWLTSQPEKFSFFLHEKINLDSAVKLLLEHYKPPTAQNLDDPLEAAKIKVFILKKALHRISFRPYLDSTLDDIVTEALKETE